MLTIDDDATVHALFQAHSFEDLVLKMDRVHIGRGSSVGEGAVVFYGATIGEGAYVAPHGVVMKHEHLVPGRSYVGCPTEAEPETVLVEEAVSDAGPVRDSMRRAAAS
jgi:acetyltransferase-like isoleucine patch superfamily enzyme